jgi:uncharacterized protein (TIGR02118 family)
MIKVVMFVHRRPGMEFEEFRRHYEEVHVPLALSKFRFLKRYVRNYIPPAAAAAPLCDCVTELWFDDLESLQAQARETAGDAELRADEEAFMDRERMTSHVVDERISPTNG